MRRKSYFHIDDDQIKDETNMPFEKKVGALAETSASTYNLAVESPYCFEKKDAPQMSNELLLEAIEIINNLQTDYCLIGGFAVTYYGCIRAARDIDFLVLFEDKVVLKQKQQELTTLGCSVDYRKGGIDDPVGDMLVVKKGNVKIEHYPGQDITAEKYR